MGRFHCLEDHLDLHKGRREREWCGTVVHLKIKNHAG